MIGLSCLPWTIEIVIITILTLLIPDYMGLPVFWVAH